MLDSLIILYNSYKYIKYKNIYYILVGIFVIISTIYVGSNAIYEDLNNNEPIHINIEHSDGDLDITLNEIHVDNQYINIYFETNTTNPSPSNDSIQEKIIEGESIVISDFDCKKDRIYVFVNNTQYLHYPANQSCWIVILFTPSRLEFEI